LGGNDKKEWKIRRREEGWVFNKKDDVLEMDIRG